MQPSTAAARQDDSLAMAGVDRHPARIQSDYFIMGLLATQQRQSSPGQWGTMAGVLAM